MTIEDVSDSFLMSMMDSAEAAHGCEAVVRSNILSQLAEDEPPIFAGQLETLDGQVMPFTIGKTDIGNGKPRPFIHISDHPSIANRHVTITTVQTKDGKFRASLRQNHPQATVLLGGSIIRPNVSYPVTDDDEISLGEGFTFRLRLNNQPSLQGRASMASLGAPTPHYVPSPDSEASYEKEEQLKLAKRKEFLIESDESFLLKLVAGDDEEFTLNHQPVDTCPFTSGTDTQQDDHIGGHALDDVVDDIAGDHHAVDDIVGDEHGEDICEQPDDLDVNIEDVIDDQSDPIVDEDTNLAENVQDESPGVPMSGVSSLDLAAPPFMMTGSDIDDVKPAVTAPKLSQVDDDESLLDRVQRRLSKRSIGNPIDEEPFGKRGKTEESFSGRTSQKVGKTEESFSGRSSQKVSLESSSGRASQRVSPTTLGPKKLIILKTSVNVDKATETAVSALGGKLETKWSNKVEALVTNKIVRTTKFLCAINKGLPIFPVSILAEIRANRALPVVDDSSKWLLDPEGEAKYEFSLKKSIETAQKRPLFRNFEVFFFKNGIGEFSSEEFKDLITFAGGKVVSKLLKSEEGNENNIDGGIIVIGNESNRAAAKNSGLTSYHKVEFIVDSCIKQKINFEHARIEI